MSVPEPAPIPHLTIARLAVHRGQRELFRDLDLSVASGQCVFVRGPNGAGKSSLLLALAGMIRPEAGSIEFDGASDDGERATQLHFVGHQSAVKHRLTLAENLKFWAATYGRPAMAAEAALERVGLGGLDTIEAGHLSAGQTRRLALARLLVAARPIWLLDEPTSSLDAKGDALVGALISGHIRAGGIAIVATHLDIALDPGLDSQTLVLQ